MKKGAQVIAMSNGEGYENGSIGNVVGFTKNDSNDPCVWYVLKKIVRN
ncbi:hypothetical protein [Lactobacillus crispatus]